MLQFLAGMYLELVGDCHVLRAFQDLRIHDVGDDGLVFSRKVLIQELCQSVTRDGLSFVSGFRTGHLISPSNPGSVSASKTKATIRSSSPAVSDVKNAILASMIAFALAKLSPEDPVDE